MIEYRATRPFTGLEPGSLQLGLDASRERLLAGHRGRRGARARVRRGRGLRRDVRERAARPRLAHAAQRPGPADPRRVRGEPEHRRGARRRRPGADAVARTRRRGRRLLLRRPGAGQRDRQRAVRRRQPVGQAADHLPAQREPARAARHREPVGHARRPHGRRTTRASSSATAATTAPASIPLFPFGHGLSYTSFAYRNLQTSRAGRRRARCSFTVRNTGQRTGAEAAQVYVGALPTSVPTPPKQLAGFAKVTLDPGRARARHRDARPARVLVLRRGPQRLGDPGRPRADLRRQLVAGHPADRQRHRDRGRRRTRSLPRGAITGIGGKCVDVAGGAAPTARRSSSTTATARPRSAGASPRTARSRRSASASTSPAARTANGTAVQLYECNNTGAQQWEAADRRHAAQPAVRTLPRRRRRELGQRHPADHLGLPRRRQPALAIA